MADPKFELYKDATGKFRFRLLAPNGEIIAVGEAYESKRGCINGMESVKRNVLKADVMDLTRGKTIKLEVEKKVGQRIQMVEKKSGKIDEANLPWMIGLAFGTVVLILAFAIMIAIQVGLITL